MCFSRASKDDVWAGEKEDDRIFIAFVFVAGADDGLAALR